MVFFIVFQLRSGLSTEGVAYNKYNYDVTISRGDHLYSMLFVTKIPS